MFYIYFLTQKNLKMKTKKITRFEDIESWELARELAAAVWQISNQGSFLKDRDLYWQINRATGSTMDNIAEGFGRGGNREFINFLTIARASNDEVRSQVYRAFDRSHISEEECTRLCVYSTATGTKINNFINYLKSSEIKGHKFK